MGTAAVPKRKTSELGSPCSGSVLKFNVPLENENAVLLNALSGISMGRPLIEDQDFASAYPPKPTWDGGAATCPTDALVPPRPRGDERSMGEKRPGMLS